MEASMLKKLRTKFVVLNMTMVAVVLVTVLVSICVINYQQSVSSVYAALDSAISRSGDAGENQPPADMGDAQPPADTGDIQPHGAKPDTKPDSSPESSSTSDASEGTFASDINNASDVSNSSSTNNTSDVSNSSSVSSLDSAESTNDATNDESTQPTPPEIGGEKRDGDSVIPVAVYSIEDDGTLSAVSAMTTASIADDVLTTAASALENKGEGEGFLSEAGLFYAKRNVGGVSYVAFADESSATSWQTLALTLTGAGVGALLIFFVISVFFARWALRPVEAAWTQQQRFIADASHELKTPLTVILANTSILRAHPERSIASQSQWVESTQTEAERMQELVCDMLDLAKPAAMRTQGKNAHTLVDLTDLVEGDLLQFESVAFERAIHLEALIDPHVSIVGDPTRLHRLTSTLFDNACKYANDGGSVTVRLRQSVRNIQLSVNNTGAPIDPEDLPHLFDRFYRADKARTSTQGSYGLGLAIAREIAQEHAGTINVESTEVAGTTFTVTFPIPPAA